MKNKIKVKESNILSLKHYSVDYLDYIIYGLAKSLQAQNTLEINCNSSISFWLARAAQENNGIHHAIYYDYKPKELTNLGLNDYVVFHKYMYDFNQYNESKELKLDLIYINPVGIINTICDINLSCILNDSIIINNYNNCDIQDYCNKMFGSNEWNSLVINNTNIKHNKDNMVFICQRK